MTQPQTTAIRTELGPLTTTFVPPPDCSSILWYTSYTDWHGLQAHNFQCGYKTYTTSGTGGSTVTSIMYKLSSLREICFPSGFASYMNRPASLDVAPGTGLLHFFSPGLVCPAGFTTACAIVKQTDVPLPPGDPVGVWSLLRPGETAVGCCPRFGVIFPLHDSGG